MVDVFILIPAYNAAKYLSKTVASVIDQTSDNWECIILDDCSTDNTYEIAKSWEERDGRIKALRNERNLGMLENWNKGIELCRAPFFVKLDADDIWHSEMLHRSLEILLRHPEVALVFSRYTEINEEGQEMGVSEPLPSFVKNEPFSCVPIVKEGPDKMLSYPILRQGLSVMRYEIFQAIGKYRYLLSKETQAATDTEFYFRVGAHYKIYCIDEILYYYRKHQQSISSTDSRSFLSDKKLYEIKKTIIQYYHKVGHLSAEKYGEFIKKIDLVHGFSLIAMYRRNGAWIKFSTKFLAQIITYPLQTISFYLNQITKRNA